MNGLDNVDISCNVVSFFQMFGASFSSFLCHLEGVLCDIPGGTRTTIKWIFFRRPSIFIIMTMIGTLYIYLIRGNIYRKDRTSIRTKSVIQIFLIFMWIFILYQGLHLQSCDAKPGGQPPDLQAQNYIVYASNNQICTLRSLTFVYSCTEVRVTIDCKKNITYIFLLLLLSGDVETNPGPASWTAIRQPDFCNFLRVALYMVFEGLDLLPDPEGRNNDTSVTVSAGFIHLKNLYGDHYQAHLSELKPLQKNIKNFLNTMKEWGKNNCSERNEYCNIFSPINWKNLEDLVKKKHTVSCNECPRLNGHGLFPSKTNKYQKERLNSPAYAIQHVEKVLKKSGKKVLKDCTNQALIILNKSFGQTHGINFEDSLLISNNFEKKQSREEKRQLKKLHYREVVDKINSEFELSSVDRLYGSRTSLRKWDVERKKRSFETVPEAISRSVEDKRKVASGQKTPKNHVGNFSSYDISPSLLDMAGSWTDETKVNWKQIGDQCIRSSNDNIPANSGQIVKTFLEYKEINEGFQYTYKGKNEPKHDRFRRSKKRLLSGVSFPGDPSSDAVKLLMEEKVSSGEIDVGETIVQKEYKKRIFDKSTGQVVEHTFSVFGRKHSLHKIRVKLFRKCKKFMRLNPDSYFHNISKIDLINRLSSICESVNENENLNTMKERLKTHERTRHLQVWHDGSSIANHGHIVFCVNVLYDPAVFYTSAEYAVLAKTDVNVQREVEEPELYIIGRCPSNDEQLAYINTRVEDLRGLETGITLSDIDESYPDIVVYDTMRFFHGDGPAAAFEAGNQKGGHYFCPSCDVHSCQTDDIACCYQKKTKSFSEKRELIMQGNIGRINSLRRKTLPFEKLSISELQSELTSRKVDLEKFKATMKDLIPLLKRELRGIKRLPVLLINDPLSDLNQLGLAKYEITLVECMHDIAYHIDNILVELPNHLRPDDKIKFNEVLDALNAEKEKNVAVINEKYCCFLQQA